ncbi:UDP-N-acetylglucosamine 2-epimerase [Arthrobacter sp. Y-9]|uniref:UDP-N-acetyl glucosamine 2-epimerase n=1 Tax=Arthrobacter sp. Y-9 TaxID=3039385 RepID=UPI00241EB414|nr:UDP-N-acetylglucosamine 2-epimerase [Arthrobacter sp. Y-9]WFR84293.1 UDP-N-acetylglucosamine 2-epimerase [Arthrobacter sp. Y-9]
MNTADIAVVLGTPSEAIKLAHVIAALGEHARVLYDISQTNDPTDHPLAHLGLAPTTVTFRCTGSDRGTQISNLLHTFTQEFTRRRPSVLIVCGASNSAVAAAQAASFSAIPVLHAESGIRSYDRSSPEEINRLILTAVTDLHCAATSNNLYNLIGEYVDTRTIAVTGSTSVEAVSSALSLAETLPGDHSPVLEDWAEVQDLVLVSVNRPENVGSAPQFKRLLEGLAGIAAPVLMVLHPRTREALNAFGLENYSRFIPMIDPVEHYEFVRLARAAALVISDSGTIQEECTVVKTPCLVLRRSTDRPESIDAGFACLLTPDRDPAAAANALLTARPHLRLSQLTSPYGDGKASERVALLALQLAAGASASEAIAEVEQTHPFLRPHQLLRDQTTPAWQCQKSSSVSSALS